MEYMEREVICSDFAWVKSLASNADVTIWTFIYKNLTQKWKRERDPLKAKMCSDVKYSVQIILFTYQCNFPRNSN